MSVILHYHLCLPISNDNFISLALTSQYEGASYRIAWLAATNHNGAFEWSDGTPVTGAVFTAADITGKGASAVLRNDGRIKLWGTTTINSYPVVCLSQ